MIREKVSLCLCVVAALVALAVSAGEALAQNTCPAASPNDYVPDDGPLQDCLNAGGTIALSPGSPGYILAAGLRLAVSGTVITSAAAPTQATIVADAGLDGFMISNRDGIALNNWELSFLIWDGNNYNRTNYSGKCSTDYRPRGITASLKGDGFVIKNNHFVNAMCGSSLEISGAGFSVYSNSIVNSGFPLASAPGGTQPFADGITTLRCVNSGIWSNYIENASDIGIVVGLNEATGCQVTYNTVKNTSRYGLAGISNGGAYDHGGTLIANNTIESSLNQLAFGVFVGEGPWCCNTYSPYVGQVVHNTISGAVVNLAVDNIGGGEVRDNALYGARGTQGMGCSWPAELTYGAIGSAIVQSGGVYRRYGHGSCTPYADAPPSTRLTGPGWGTMFQEGATVTLNADASDPDSYVSRVDFFAGPTLIGSDYSAPYSLSVPNAPPGQYYVSSVASDATSAGPQAGSVYIRVNAAPLTSIASPASGSVFPVGSTVTVAANASDPDGNVTRVDFWVNGGLAASDYTAPFSMTAPGVPWGNYNVHVVAHDNHGGSRASGVVTIYVR